MALAYLLPDVARTRLLATGEYTQETVPTVEALEFVLECIEILMDEWLGCRLAVEQHVDEYLRVNGNGIALLHEYPVLSIDVIKWVHPQLAGFQSSLTPTPIPVLTDGDRALRVGSPGMAVLATYTTGYDPLPRPVPMVTFNLLRAALKESGTTGDLTFLQAPTRDVTNVSIPGGLSKGFKVNTVDRGDALRQKGETMLDRLLSPISRYRRLIVT